MAVCCRGQFFKLHDCPIGIWHSGIWPLIAEPWFEIFSPNLAVCWIFEQPKHRRKSSVNFVFINASSSEIFGAEKKNVQKLLFSTQSSLPFGKDFPTDVCIESIV